MTTTYDALETRPPAQREADLMAALARQVAHAQAHASAFGRSLHGVDAGQVTSRAALAKLPVIRKHELLEMQRDALATTGDVFGGFSAIGWGPGLWRGRGRARAGPDCAAGGRGRQPQPCIAVLPPQASTRNGCVERRAVKAFAGSGSENR